MENNERANAESSLGREKAYCGLVQPKDALVSDESNKTGTDTLIYL